MIGYRALVLALNCLLQAMSRVLSRPGQDNIFIPTPIHSSHRVGSGNSCKSQSLVVLTIYNISTDILISSMVRLGVRVRIPIGYSYSS